MSPALSAAMPAEPPVNSTHFTFVFGRFFSTMLPANSSASFEAAPTLTQPMVSSSGELPAAAVNVILPRASVVTARAIKANFALRENISSLLSGEAAASGQPVQERQNHLMPGNFCRAVVCWQAAGLQVSLRPQSQSFSVTVSHHKPSEGVKRRFPPVALAGATSLKCVFACGSIGGNGCQAGEARRPVRPRSAPQICRSLGRWQVIHRTLVVLLP